jgi:hypothetical protein
MKEDVNNEKIKQIKKDIGINNENYNYEFYFWKIANINIESKHDEKFKQFIKS